MKQGPLPAPQLDWDDKTPRAVGFDDIYFNPEDGLAETRHVFLQGTDLSESWSHFPETARPFTIGELGFGTGLNVLAAWQLWRKTKPTNARLHIVSVEGFPLTQDQLEKAHEAFPELSEFSARLRQVLSPRARGFHLLELDPDVSLQLLYGEATEMLRGLSADVDAWFLDGFAPSANAEMWSPEVMAEIARCSRAGTRLASFTVAGDVRRSLQGVGFEVEKAPGFGRKRHMLKAQFKDLFKPPLKAETRQQPSPWFARPAPIENKRIAIIGAGIAGTALAQALEPSGHALEIFDAASGPGIGASSTPAGIVVPRLGAEADPLARFYAGAFHHAIAAYEEAGLLSKGGALRLPPSPEDIPRLQRTMETGLFDESQLALLSPQEASKLAGTEVLSPALYFKQAGALNAPAFIAQALEGQDVSYATTVERIKKQDDGWQLLGSDDQIIAEADIVVVAAGMASLRILNDMRFPLVARNGQVTKISGDASTIPIAFSGYVVPNEDSTTWIGATHDRTEPDTTPALTAGADQHNLDGLKGLLPNVGKDAEILDGWAGIRATSPDFMPIAGPIPDRETYLSAYEPLKDGMRFGLKEAEYRSGLFVVTGLGSRGFVTAPLLAELIAAYITGAPLPVDREVAHVLHPGRFLIRGLVRNQTYAN